LVEEKYLITDKFMNTNQRGFKKIVLILIIIVLFGIAGYLVLTNKLEKPPAQLQTKLNNIKQESASVKFLSPTENDEWRFDKRTYEIRWTTDNVSWDTGQEQEQTKNGKVYLYLTKGDYLDAGGAFHIGVTDFSQGSYKWTIPEYELGPNFINDKVQIVLVIHPRDSLPPSPFTMLRDLKIKPYIVYSPHFIIKPIEVHGAKFTFPIGGERLILGRPLIVKWELPSGIRVSDVTLMLNPVDYYSDINGYLHKEAHLSNDTRSYTWNGKFMYIPVGSSFSSVEVKPGKYFLELGFRTIDGYYQSIETGQFELVNP
jgi:hypothetical protein